MKTTGIFDTRVGETAKIRDTAVLRVGVSATPTATDRARRPTDR